jgi:hypothetical protein
VVVAFGLTGDVTVVLKAASEYQVRFPAAQVAVKVELWPEQMLAGPAAAAVGAAGVGVTVTRTLVEGLLHTPFTQAA